jgi:hypothetical protein
LSTAEPRHDIEAPRLGPPQTGLWNNKSRLWCVSAQKSAARGFVGARLDRPVCGRAAKPECHLARASLVLHQTTGERLRPTLTPAELARAICGYGKQPEPDRK